MKPEYTKQNQDIIGFRNKLIDNLLFFIKLIDNVIVQYMQKLMDQ